MPKKRASSKSRRSTRPASSRAFRSRAAKPVAENEGRLSFNHAMIYVKDVGRSLRFYRDLLGFKLVEDFLFENQPVYARLRAPGGDGTIALHQAGPSDAVASDGVRLYFEVGDLDEFCRKLLKQNFFITKLPAMMPWGWRHAYLNDPDGHEISLYWSAGKRMRKTMSKAAQEATSRVRRRR